MTAALVARGMCARVTSGSSVWVAASAMSGMGRETESHALIPDRRERGVGLSVGGQREDVRARGLGRRDGRRAAVPVERDLPLPGARPARPFGRRRSTARSGRAARRRPRPAASTTVASAAAAASRHPRPSDSAGAGEQQRADRHVDRRAGDEHRLEADQRQQHQPAARSRRRSSPSVFQAYTAPIARSPGAADDQRAGDERQRHAGAEGGRQHDQQAEAVAGDGEAGVARRRCGQRSRAARPPSRTTGRRAVASPGPGIPSSTGPCRACGAGSASRSARERIHQAPSARPRMKAESISSNECVALPSTSASIRIQSIS